MPSPLPGTTVAFPLVEPAKTMSRLPSASTSATVTRLVWAGSVNGWNVRLPVLSRTLGVPASLTPRVMSTLPSLLKSPTLTTAA